MRPRIVTAAAALAAAGLGLLPAPPAPAASGGARLGDRPLERGDRGPDVRELQRTLRRLRLRTAVDGAYGRHTATQVRRYERRHRIRVDGEVSPGQARGLRKRAGLPFAGRPGRRAPAARRSAGAGAPPGPHFPVRGEATWGDGFGTRGGRHQGIDLLADCGTTLVAPVAGTVVNVKRHDAAGHYLVVRDAATGEEHVLMHLARPPLVAKGDEVAAGQRVGEVGRTGNASACHLHFEIWTAPGWYRGGDPRDPEPDLRRWAAPAPSRA
ncbi:MAG TPA: M23 family metallopeptidase [Baekduia sp.]|nr:M23 family metallopeptidase [Baekduia sp.]